MIRSITGTAALALAGMLSPAMAETGPGTPLLPQVVVPEPAPTGQFGAPRARMAEGDLEGAAMIEEIRKQIGDRYVTDMSWSDDDRERLSLLVSGTYLNDYMPQGSGVGISNGHFIPPKVEAAAAGDAAGSGEELAGLALSPAGIRAMAMMTPDQIKAIALMAELSRNPDADLAALLASAGAETGTPRGAVGPAGYAMHVGDGNNLALIGWYAGEQDGTVYIENDQFLGSRVGVELGSVIGQFGHVTEIERGAGGIVVSFESGDRIASLGAPEFIGPGIPALGGDLEQPELLALPLETPASTPFGEIIVTDPAPRKADSLVRPPRRPAPVQEAVASAADRKAEAGEG